MTAARSQGEKMTEDDRLHELLFSVRRSVRYHMRRVAFFDAFNTSVQVLSLAFGSITVYTLLQRADPAISATVAALVTVVAAVNLVVGSTRKARKHQDLAKAFIALEREITREKTPTDENLRRWTDKRLEIEAEEPPVLRVLDSICHNELVRAMGCDESHIVEIGFLQRMLAQFADVREHKIRRVGA